MREAKYTSRDERIKETEWSKDKYEVKNAIFAKEFVKGVIVRIDTSVKFESPWYWGHLLIEERANGKPPSEGIKIIHDRVILKKIR